MQGFQLFLTVAIVIFVAVLMRRKAARQRLAARVRFIQSYGYPPGLHAKLRKRYPELTESDCGLVESAMRHFFLAYLKSGCKPISMPSQVVDELWHELILYTRTYEIFCRKAFGRFFHHTPAAVLGDAKRSDARLHRCWRYVCNEENIDPKAPSRLPLLFGLDEQLNIPDGFRYSLNCHELNSRLGASVVHCAGDLASCGGDGGNSWWGWGDDDSGSDSDSDSGGGGDGCSGGCSGGCGGGD